MQRAIIYLRVSTEDQAESGLGLDAQLAATTKKAREIGAIQVLTFTDAGISGSTPIEKRPGLSQALAEVRRGDSLLVAKRDRLSRSLPIAIAVEELLRARKARLISVSGEGTEDSGENVGTLMQSRLWQVFGEIERQMIRDRTKAALAVKKVRGERVGNIPYGYRLSDDGVHLEPEAGEQSVISFVAELRAKGLTFKEIVSRLNQDGVQNRSGKAWQYRSVWNIAHATHPASGQITR